MNDTLKYIIKRFELDISGKPPIEIHKINRTIMAKTLGELTFKEGAEVGVAEGYHARCFLR